MTLRLRAAVAAALLAALAGAAVLGAAAAPARTGHAAASRITARAVGGVRLHARYSTVRHRHLVGRLHAGCDLEGPSARVAKLRSPLKGFVDLTRSRPRRVRAIRVLGGATARGVGIGDTIADIKAAYPEAEVDHSTDTTFEVTTVRIPKSGGGRIAFAVSTKTDAIVEIGVPVIPFCE